MQRIGVGTVRLADGLVVTNSWFALVIGGLLLVALVALVASVLVRLLRASRRRKEAAVARCWGLVAEALAVRQRVAGAIDSDTYQQRMNDLAAGRRP